MALYAIADTHLSLGTDKPMDVFRGWKDYVPRLEQNWRALVAPEDTVVIAGDISWGMSLEQAAADFAFLHALPGKKLLLKGNHDYWWTTRKKMDEFFAANGWDSLRIVHNDAAPVEGRAAVCGTRGWFFDAEEDADKKVVMREAGRLQASIDAARPRAFRRSCSCTIRRCSPGRNAPKSSKCSGAAGSAAAITATCTARASAAPSAGITGEWRSG